MGEKSYVTYEDVVRFYKDKEEWPCYTKKFIEEGYGQTDGGYLDVAEVFSHMAEQAGDGCDSNPKSKDGRYYRYLMEKIKTNYKEVATFKDFESYTEISELIENRKKVTGNNGIKYPSQKWHFYVSYIAYKEFKSDIGDFAEEEFKYWRYARCPELMLWMAETALGKECPKVAAVFNGAVKELEECEKKRKAGQDIEQISEAIKTRKKEGVQVCGTIRRNIPWTCIEEKIKEKTRIDSK